MNENNNDINAEEELNELPGYIQSIINDFYTFDKKEGQIKKEENENSNLDEEEEKKEIKTDNNIYKDNEIINYNNISKEDDDDINKEDLENDMDMDIENIFNSKNDFFNKKVTEEESNKENIDNNNKIKLYSIQENNLFNIKRSFRLQSILQNNYIGYQNNTLECSICYRKIQNYGLLSNCDDVFCYDCIKQWRTEAISKNKREMFRRCPICNYESPMLIKSKNYVSGDEKRKKFYELKQEKKNYQNIQ